MFGEAVPFFCDTEKQTELLYVLSTSIPRCRAFPETVSLLYSQTHPLSVLTPPSLSIPAPRDRASQSPSSQTLSPTSLPSYYVPGTVDVSAEDTKT